MGVKVIGVTLAGAPSAYSRNQRNDKLLLNRAPCLRLLTLRPGTQVSSLPSARTKNLP
jgi:hypothetical protein